MRAAAKILAWPALILTMGIIKVFAAPSHNFKSAMQISALRFAISQPDSAHANGGSYPVHTEIENTSADTVYIWSKRCPLLSYLTTDNNSIIIIHEECTTIEHPPLILNIPPGKSRVYNMSVAQIDPKASPVFRLKLDYVSGISSNEARRHTFGYPKPTQCLSNSLVLN